MKRDLVLSFTGHALMLGLAALLSTGKVKPDLRRPAVISVHMVSAGSPLPAAAGTKTGGAALIEAKPKSTAPVKRRSPTKPAPTNAGKSVSGPFRRQGLGASVEGGEALGYSYYLNTILAKIGDNWQDPYYGDSRKVTATVLFIIERDGTLRDIRVEKSSGDETYDLAAVRALKVLDRLPPLPPEFKGARLKLHLEFEHTP